MNLNDERLLAGAELLRRWVINRPRPVIQVREDQPSAEWRGMNDMSIPTWDFSHYDYREKPKPREWLIVETSGPDMPDLAYRELPHPYEGMPQPENAIRVREME